MHYYSFNIGDYHSHTSHLEPLEDLAYRRILDRYYLQEGPLKGCSSTVARALGLASSEREVAYILDQYFTQDSEGFWRQERVEREIQKYQNHKKASSKGGKASGKARKHKASEAPLKAPSTPLEPTNNQEPITNNQEPVKKTSPRFTRPTVNEIRDYCNQRQNSIDPESFFAHYEANGWVQGKGKPIKNWKMAVITWEKSRNENNQRPGQHQDTRRLSPHERVRAAAERRAAEKS